MISEETRQAVGAALLKIIEERWAGPYYGGELATDNDGNVYARAAEPSWNVFEFRVQRVAVGSKKLAALVDAYNVLTGGRICSLSDGEKAAALTGGEIDFSHEDEAPEGEEVPF